MKLLRPLLAIVALAALCAAPAFASEHCAHASAADADAAHVAQPEADGSANRHHGAMTASAEEIPDGGGEATACKHHAGEICQCKSQMALSCGMSGCCIKSDGPLSTGLNDRLPTNDDHALQIQPAPHGVDGTMAVAAYRRTFLPRELPGPDPRPPSA